MSRFLTVSLMTGAICLANAGCMGRLISEGMGAATGAAGKVVDVQKPKDLSRYKGFKVESVTAAPGLMMPADTPALVRQNFNEAAEKKGLRPNGTPALKLVGEIIHYEPIGIVDEAMGPLEEVIVRTKLMDADTGQLLTEANLIGRSKATTSGGVKNLSEGAGKALKKWLKECGFKGDEEEQEKGKK
jgi:hypothetical protein